MKVRHIMATIAEAWIKFSYELYKEVHIVGGKRKSTQLSLSSQPRHRQMLLSHMATAKAI